MIIPPYLKKGDCIGLICPSGYMPAEKTKACVQTLQQWGFTVSIGKTTGHRHHYFSGTDEERASDLQAMLDDDNIKAILCARGGYGMSRIIQHIDYKKFKRNPKWVIGFSDITLLHNYINNKLKTASLHAPMAGAFNDGGAEGEYVQSLRAALTGKKIKYHCKPSLLNRTGAAEGELTGGNLALLAHSIGSPWEPDTKNKILFIEDTGEYLYNIDRMMLQLKYAGKLDKLSGLIVGSFSDMKDTQIPFGQDVYSIIWDKVKEYDYPVCFDFPVGHVPENYALLSGQMHRLSVTKNNISLKEIRE